MGQVKIINYRNFKKNYYCDKVFEMYNVIIAERSGMAYVVTTGTTMSSRQKSFAPKIFHLTVSHQIIIANYGVS